MEHQSTYQVKPYLNESQLRARAPSIFASAPHERVSSQYRFIPTIKIVERLEDLGWYPVRAQQSRSLNEANRETTKHLVRFRHESDLEDGLAELTPELVLSNAHNGRGTANFFAGIFRFICLNGMVIPTEQYGSVKRRHVGKREGELIEGVYEIVEGLPAILGKAEAFKQIELSPEERRVYATAALTARWGDLKDAPLQPERLLTPRRVEDNVPDLWHTYQQVQENLMKGGVPGRTKTGRSHTSRPIKSVDADVKLNKALWLLTERMAEMKS